MIGERAWIGARVARAAGWRHTSGALALAAVVSIGSSGCSSNGAEVPAASTPKVSTSATPTSDGSIHGPVDVGGGRMIYVRCAGTGSPTVILEGGDEDTGNSYDSQSRPGQGYPDLLLRPGEPRAERPGARATGTAGAGRGPGARDLRRPDPGSICPGGNLRRRLHHRGVRLAHPREVTGMVIRRRRLPVPRPACPACPWMTPSGTHRSTSRSATTCRSRRMPGPPGSRSGRFQ